jgi:hypothetical protein
MQTTTFDLDTVIAAAVTAHEVTTAALRAQREAEQQQEQQRQAAQIATCTHELRQDLGDDLFTALAIAVSWAAFIPHATATIDDEMWTIAYTAAPHVWYLTRPLGPGLACTRASLRATLLRCIAEERELRQEQQQQQARQEAERQARRAEHERCQAQLTRILAAAQRDLWPWPEHQVLTLYLWSWYVGGDTWETGWSTSDQLDPLGYAEFCAEATIQTLRLDVLAHRPIIERRSFRATDELPSALRERVRIEVPGIWLDLTDDHYRAYPDVAMWHDVGVVPCAWVRAQFTTDEPS